MNDADRALLKDYKEFVNLNGAEKLSDEEVIDFNRLLDEEREENVPPTINEKAPVDLSRWDFNHVLDPGTEDLIFAEELRNGMIVLEDQRYSIWSPSELEREEVYPGHHAKIRKEFDKTNRWARVTKLGSRQRVQTGDMGEVVNVDILYSFIAVYDDGTKSAIETDARDGWFVKLESFFPPVRDLALEVPLPKFFLNLINELILPAPDLQELVDDAEQRANQEELDEQTAREEGVTLEVEDQDPLHWEKELLGSTIEPPEHAVDENGKCTTCDYVSSNAA